MKRQEKQIGSIGEGGAGGKCDRRTEGMTQSSQSAFVRRGRSVGRSGDSQLNSFQGKKKDEGSSGDIA